MPVKWSGQLAAMCRRFRTFGQAPGLAGGCELRMCISCRSGGPAV